MLVLTRKSGQGIWIGDGVRVVVVEVKDGQVRLGIDASKDLPVYRDEIYERMRASNMEAAAIRPEDIGDTLKGLGRKGRG